MEKGEGESRMIEKIKIGWRTYEIVIDPIIDANHTKGEIVYSQSRITLTPNQAVDEMKTCLIHEILHGIFFNMGSELVSSEDFISGLTDHLYQVIKENPDFLKYIGVE